MHKPHSTWFNYTFLCIVKLDTNIFFKHYLIQCLWIAMFVVFLSMWWRRSFSTMNNMNLFFYGVTVTYFPHLVMSMYPSFSFFLCNMLLRCKHCRLFCDRSFLFTFCMNTQEGSPYYKTSVYIMSCWTYLNIIEQ